MAMTYDVQFLVHTNMYNVHLLYTLFLFRIKCSKRETYYFPV